MAYIGHNTLTPVVAPAVCGGTRENHSEIERRRRNKMSSYIQELAEIVPACCGLTRKPDKLTVLKMAVSYLQSLQVTGVNNPFGLPSSLASKNDQLSPVGVSMSELGVGGGADFASPGGCAAAVGIGGSNGVFGVPGSVGMGTGGVGASGCTGTGGYKPSFVTDEELKQLVCEAGNGFLFVLCCSSLRVSFVTDTVAQVLNVPQASWLGASMFDLIHPEDGVKLREHLAVGLPNPSPASSHMFISPSQTGGASGTSGQSAGGGGGSCIGRVLDLKSGTVKKESTQASGRSSSSCRRSFFIRLRNGLIDAPQSYPSISQMNSYVGSHSFGHAPTGHSTTPFVYPPNDIGTSFQYTGNLLHASPADSLTEGGVYSLAQVSGYLKQWTTHQFHAPQMGCGDMGYDGGMSCCCFVGLARIQDHLVATPRDLDPKHQAEFMLRVNLDGVVTFADQSWQTEE
ncbi:aryl hydrocarbon receptor nuclear translocator homolog isoform X2 [Symsagittifera roscoffensis]|uniref:aryl hydrocarbon receptor nuclear translocator homolog isoform X2 n=1 Tax=Symsagittifera roscoffensis TaxID=84072 RepID=UPI00307B3CCE